MKSTEQFQLIDGTFSASDAAQILLSIVKSKIDFHTREGLSNEERFGRDSGHSSQRVNELRKTHQMLRELCASAAESDQRLQVKGWIEITRVPWAASASSELPRVACG